MRRWNGWGPKKNKMELPETAENRILDWVGEGQTLPEAELEDVIKSIPDSMLPDHELIEKDVAIRLAYSRGQSLPDWLDFKFGDIERVTDGVAFPENSNQVNLLLALAKTHNWIVIPFGGGTSVVGHINPPSQSNAGGINSERPVLTICLAKMDKLLQLNEQSQLALVQAGAAGPLVESQLNEKGYTLGHFPQSFEYSTLGGWIATRSSGQQSLRYGRIEQLFAGGHIETLNGPMDILTIPASSAGPDLREWFMGSEGRFGIITEAWVRVRSLPQQEFFKPVFFKTWEQAQQAAQALVQKDVPLSMLRLSNPRETVTQLTLSDHPMIPWLKRLLKFKGFDEDTTCLMFFGVTGESARCHTAKQIAKNVVKKFGGWIGPGAMGQGWKKNRFKLPYLRQTLWDKGYLVDTLETATDWENVTWLMNAIESSLKDAAEELNFNIHVFTHLSHVYTQGSSIYTTYVFPGVSDKATNLARWKALKSKASECIENARATISHQHGVGVDHKPYLKAEKGTLGHRLIEEWLHSNDPNEQLNPGKLI